MPEDSLEKASKNSSKSPTNGRVAQETASAKSVPATLRDIRAALRQVEDQLNRLESEWQPGEQVSVPAIQPMRAWWTGFRILAYLAAVLVVGVRLYKLNSIQTDLYGDIQIVYQYVEGVRSGSWPFQYVLGVGPIYHYLIQPIILFTGLNYFGLKLSAVITSLGALLATYAFARRLVNDWFALLAATIAGISSWLLIFSRLGISLILVPLLAACALWLLMRIVQEGRPVDAIACAIVSAGGLYSYPQGFILPFVSFITLLCMRWAGHPISWSNLRRFVIASIIGALPFAWMFLQSPEDFIHGYIGSKFFAEENPFQALLHNIAAAAMAYHVKGDSIFRSNPNYLPHLDFLSGLLFLAGIVFWLQPARRKWSPVLFVPFVLLHLPSILALGRPGEVPSAGRTLGAAPIAYILVASGLWWLLEFFARLGRQRIGVAITGIFLAAIFVLNMQRYFGAYIGGLPYHDTSIGGEIAHYADMLPPETQIYVVGARWEASMPELPFVKLVAARSQNLHELDPNTLTCDQLASLPEQAVLIWSFHESLPAPQIDSCKGWLPAQLYMSQKGLPVFFAAPLLRDQR